MFTNNFYDPKPLCCTTLCDLLEILKKKQQKHINGYIQTSSTLELCASHCLRLRGWRKFRLKKFIIFFFNNHALAVFSTTNKHEIIKIILHYNNNKGTGFICFHFKKRKILKIHLEPQQLQQQHHQYQHERCLALSLFTPAHTYIHICM